jgi:hypothetical protein
LGISTWKIFCSCPTCGREYLLSEVKASFIVTLPLLRPTFLPTWRFRALPDNLYCENCGTIESRDVQCQLPIDATAPGLNRFILIASLIAVGFIIGLVLVKKSFGG